MHFFKAVPFRRNDPALDPVVTRFFGAAVDRVRSELYPAAGEAAPPMRLTKNVYRLPKVFIANTNLIVSEAARDELSVAYVGNYLPCELERCFEYPYRPGDTSFEGDPCFRLAPPQDAEAIVRQFAAHYGCACPAVPLFELVPHRLRDVAGATGKKWKDSVHVRLSDADNGLQTVESNVSPSMVEEFGIIWDWGYWCRDDVFAVIDPLLTKPYFWTGRVRI